jgi:hypothetical protein
MYARAEIQLHKSLTSAADGMLWEDASPGQSTPGVQGIEKTLCVPNVAWALYRRECVCTPTGNRTQIP